MKDSYQLGADQSRRAYRLQLTRGRRLSVTVATRHLPSRIYVRLIPDGRAAGLYAVACTLSRAGVAEMQTRIPATDVYRVTVNRARFAEDSEAVVVAMEMQTGPSLGFPVAGECCRAVSSVFGAPRDGGRRRHLGIDIRAPRYTPVVAATDGEVWRLGSTMRGGREIWLREESTGLLLYYAHLHTRFVRMGTKISAGDTIGLVGSTGNAPERYPHLHFGIYVQGFVDPFPYLSGSECRPEDASSSLWAWAEEAREERDAVIAYGGRSHRTGQRMLDIGNSTHASLPWVAGIAEISAVSLTAQRAGGRETLPD